MSKLQASLLLLPFNGRNTSGLSGIGAAFQGQAGAAANQRGIRWSLEKSEAFTGVFPGGGLPIFQMGGAISG